MVARIIAAVPNGTFRISSVIDMSRSKLIAAVDIGKSKCVVLLGSKQDSAIEILGCGVEPLQGAIRNGFIIDINRVSDAVSAALRAARITANNVSDNIASFMVSISAPLCASKEVVEDLSPESQKITRQDTDQLIALIQKREAQNSEKSASSEVIHILPLCYSVDDLERLHNPCGQSGSKLTVKAHLVAARPVALKNIRACLQSYSDSDARVEVVLEQLASAKSTLRPKDYEFGQVALVDIGAETTKVAILQQPDEPIYTGYIKCGGKQLTDNLQELFNLSPSKAEELKILHGSAFPETAGTNSLIVPSVYEYEDERLISREELANCCKDFYLEIMQQLQKSTPILAAEGDFAVRTLVFTGGASAIEGLYDLARSFEPFEHLRVRVAAARLHNDRNPALLEHPKFATAVGLLHCAPSVVDQQVLESLSANLIGEVRSSNESEAEPSYRALLGYCQDIWYRAKDKLHQRVS